MLIQCTKALQDKLGIKNEDLASDAGYEEFPERFMAWHANFIKINRRQVVILVNNETRYPVVIFGLYKKDFANIEDLIFEAVREALRIEGVASQVIDDYLNKAGAVSFSKTGSRSMISKMNNAAREVEFMEKYIDENTKIQSYISMVTGRLLQMEGPHQGFYPIEKMLEGLERIYGDEKNALLDVDLYQLKIQINLEGHEIWRRVYVPSTFSFRQLHYTIQTVFDWQNYHLHEFVVERGEMKPVQILMDDEPETLDFVDEDTFDIRQERFVALEDIFSTWEKVRYEYDFGDAWEHTITKEKVVKSTELEASYLEGKGERPPEDVGGEGGFEDYLRVMADEKDPEHFDIKEWAKHQRERNLTPETVNKRVKQVHQSPSFSTIVLE